MVRGKDFFSKIVENVRNFTHLQRELNVPKPVVSLWLTGLRETVDQLPNFVRLAHTIGVREVYLQRLVFFDSPQNEHSLARAESALFEHTTEREESLIHEAASVAKDLGILFSASGATEPGESIKKQRDDAPWSLCRRPWSLMYITANGRVLPCCIAPVQHEGIQFIHARRRDPANPARDLERQRISAIPRRPAHLQPTTRAAPTVAYVGASKEQLKTRSVQNSTKCRPPGVRAHLPLQSKK